MENPPTAGARLAGKVFSQRPALGARMPFLARIRIERLPIEENERRREECLCVKNIDLHRAGGRPAVRKGVTRTDNETSVRAKPQSSGIWEDMRLIGILIAFRREGESPYSVAGKIRLRKITTRNRAHCF